MLGAGLAWGIYSIYGSNTEAPIRVTAENFSRSLPFTAVLFLLPDLQLQFDTPGVCYAVASGAVASGLGYLLWYSVLPALKNVRAATVELSVPVIAALGGILFLGESLTPRFMLSATAILGGIVVIFRYKPKERH